jgi:hypothetical protein
VQEDDKSLIKRGWKLQSIQKSSFIRSDLGWVVKELWNAKAPGRTSRYVTDQRNVPYGRGALRGYGYWREVVGGLGGHSLLGAALAGYQDADAFDHLGCGACALWEEDVCVSGAVEGVDGAGDDHRGEARVKLLGAADELVAVHLGHDEVTEEQVDAAGC